MADSPRLEELRRRVQQDPASIAFAALAEEYRRAGRFQDAIATCTAGLQRHPAYLSAHVTLGRALIEVGRYEDATEELQFVLRLAPENLAAIRGLAEVQQRRGEDAADATDHAAASEAPPPNAALPRLSAPPVPGVPQPPAIPAPTPAVAVASPAVTPPIAIPEPMPVPELVEITLPPSVESVRPVAVPPALAGLESFLAAIVRARASARL
jgi:tetratricopeptide (TPR) repeat protein